MELGGEAEDAEAKAREHEINDQRRLLIIGLIFTVPLIPAFDGQGFRPASAFFYTGNTMEGMREAQPWFGWLMLVCRCLFSFMLAGNIMSARTRRCATNPPTWMC